jgi:hypothetical protein
VTQHRVTGRMSEAVVDAFETVEVHEQHGKTGADSSELIEQISECLAEGRSIVDSCKRVVVGKLLQLKFEVHRPAMLVPQFLQQRTEQKSARQSKSGRDQRKRDVLIIFALSMLMSLRSWVRLMRSLNWRIRVPSDETAKSIGPQKV